MIKSLTCCRSARLTCGGLSKPASTARSRPHARMAEVSPDRAAGSGAYRRWRRGPRPTCRVGDWRGNGRRMGVAVADGFRVGDLAKAARLPPCGARRVQWAAEPVDASSTSLSVQVSLNTAPAASGPIGAL